MKNFLIILVAAIFIPNISWAEVGFLDQVVSTVRRICHAPTEKSEYLEINGAGNLKGDIRVKLLGMIGADGNLSFTKKEWDGVQNVLQEHQAGDNESYRKCATDLTPIFLEKALKAQESNVNEVEKRSAVESQIKKVIEQNKTAADTLCTIAGSVDGSEDWESFKHWVNSTAMLYIEPESAERMILSSSFLDAVSKTTFSASRAALDGINSNTKLYLANNKEELKSMLKQLDRQYQFLSEILLYEIGASQIPNGIPLKTRLATVSRDPRNSWYCDETKYQISTKQTLGR